MFYFIPSWYNNNRPWYDETPLWFRVFERMTFDDTINQLKMFRQSKEAAQLLILNYQPQLRYFLHKQDILGTDYWSFFDDIQNISSKTTNPISYKSLNWPSDTHFVYSPFAVLALQGNRLLAYIHFAENGNLLRIEFQKDNQPHYHYVFDDRGFVSSVLYFDEQGHEYYQDYLNPNGVWQVREWLQGDEGIVVNPNADNSFRQLSYATWKDLIVERLAVFSAKVTDDDTMVISAHKQHNHLIEETFPNQSKILSFFNRRYPLEPTEELKTSLEAASLVVIDTESEEMRFKEVAERLGVSGVTMTRLSTFDTRLRLGRSQTIKELIVYFYIDTITAEELEQVLMTLLAAMETNPLIQLQLVSFDTGLDQDKLLKLIAKKIETYFNPANFYTLGDDTSENHLEEEEELENKRVSIAVLTNENQLISHLDTARLVLDLGQEPDTYTQIASLSAGIPQINAVKSDYVTHQENGWILDDFNQLDQAVQYYFDGLANWNRSLVYAVQKMGDYTSGRLLAEWLTLLENERGTR
ncbi:accessory Sec system protein Asp1 [Streptococcus saliviloxodontae]|uniref:Accessory secretory protein Asp1 n=1 Tax=Streptococcus saliviloxodontae TaxID=1349416 RepID=A0ABS2PL65_9STRE|nr:accessory secretory protein Asp1 [Streptococcus saliviloxodontae]